MSQTVAALLEAALALSEAERAELVVLISASIPTPSSTLHPDWSAELRRRAAELDSGKVRPIPWDEVRREAQAQLDAGGPTGG